MYINWWKITAPSLKYIKRKVWGKKFEKLTTCDQGKVKQVPGWSEYCE